MATPSTSLLGKIKNGFLTFLQDGLGVVEKVLPFLSPFLPAGVISAISAGTGQLDAIMSVVTNVEAAAANMGAAATPSAKLAAAKPQVTAIVQEWLKTGLPGGAKVQDQAMFTKGVDDLTSAVVTILNSVGD